MRKLIIILLIAVIACVEVDNTPKEEVSDFNELLDLLDLDANSVELFLDFLKKFWNKVKGVFGKIWKVVKGPVEWLKDKGIWDQLISLAKTGTKSAVTSLCSKHFSESICKPVVEGVYKLI